MHDIDRIDVDLIISTQELKSPEMVSVSWLADYAVAVCGASTAPSWQALTLTQVLESAPLIMDEHYPDWAPWLAALQLTPKRGITLEDVRLRLTAAEDGLGIAMVSSHVADAALRLGRVVALPAIPSFALPDRWLTKSNLKPRTPAVEIVFEWLSRYRTPEVHGDVGKDVAA